jgi:hypothetical protein
MMEVKFGIVGAVTSVRAALGAPGAAWPSVNALQGAGNASQLSIGSSFNLYARDAGPQMWGFLLGAQRTSTCTVTYKRMRIDYWAPTP